MKSLLVLFFLALTSCMGYVSDPTAKWPDFPQTEYPRLEVVTKDELAPLSPEARQKILDNDMRLKNGFERLAAQIKRYQEIKSKHGQ